MSRRFKHANGKRTKYFDIICDDEGLFSDAPYISALDSDFRPMLVGSLLVVGGADEEGNLTSLTDEDVRQIERYVYSLSTRKHPHAYKMLVNLDY